MQVCESSSSRNISQGIEPLYYLINSSLGNILPKDNRAGPVQSTDRSSVSILELRKKSCKQRNRSGTDPEKHDAFYPAALSHRAVWQSGMRTQRTPLNQTPCWKEAMKASRLSEASPDGHLLLRSGTSGPGFLPLGITHPSLCCSRQEGKAGRHLQGEGQRPTRADSALRSDYPGSSRHGS